MNFLIGKKAFQENNNIIRSVLLFVLQSDLGALVQCILVLGALRYSHVQGYNVHFVDCLDLCIRLWVAVVCMYVHVDEEML